METVLGLTGLFILMIIQVIIPPIPAELIVISSGKFYGIWISTLVAGSGLYLGSVVVYGLGYSIHQKFNRFFNQEKAQKIINGFQRNDRWILWIRILPYNPSDLIAYAAGLAKTDRKTFIMIACFTSYIRCGLLSWLGFRIEDLKEVFMAAGLLVFSAILSYVVLFKRA